MDESSSIQCAQHVTSNRQDITNATVTLEGVDEALHLGNPF